MLLIAGQTIPRGGQLTVDPIGEGETMGFKVTAAGPNAKIGPAVPPLLAGEAGADPLDAHRIQPFYAGMLARAMRHADEHGDGRRRRRRQREIAGIFDG